MDRKPLSGPPVVLATINKSKQRGCSGGPCSDLQDGHTAMAEVEASTPVVPLLDRQSRLVL